MTSLLTIPPMLVECLRVARHMVVLTGAGVSQESGLRTFRDSQTGLWAQYKPEDLATPEAFLRDPKLVWDWYAMRREKVGAVQPNLGHFALARIEKRASRFTLITQNVDGLHRKAGSVNVVELHGNLQRVKCFSCGRQAEDWDKTSGEMPRCRFCNGLLRPDVVWFGEQLPLDALQAALEAARGCDLFLSVGTSGLVRPASSLAQEARKHGARLVEVNLEPTPLSAAVDFALHGRSGEILPALAAAAWPE